MAKITLQQMNDRQNAYIKANREEIKKNITNIANAAARVVTLEGKANTEATKMTAVEGKVTTAEGKITTLESTVNGLKSNSIAVAHLTPSGTGTIDAQLKALVASPVNHQSAWVDVSAAKDGSAWDLYVYDGTNWAETGTSSTHQVAAYNDAPLIQRITALETATLLDDTNLAATEAITF